MDTVAFIIGKAIKNKSTIVLSSTAIIANRSATHSFETQYWRSLQSFHKTNNGSFNQRTFSYNAKPYLYKVKIIVMMILLHMSNVTAIYKREKTFTLLCHKLLIWSPLLAPDACLSNWINKWFLYAGSFNSTE